MCAPGGRFGAGAAIVRDVMRAGCTGTFSRLMGPVSSCHQHCKPGPDAGALLVQALAGASAGWAQAQAPAQLDWGHLRWMLWAPAGPPPSPPNP